MKIIALLTAGLFALPAYAQGEQESRVAQLEAQLARYRKATDKLVATLTETNQQLNNRVKELSKEQGKLTIQVAELQVQLERAHQATGRRDRSQGRRRVTTPPIPKVGLIYRSEYLTAVDSLDMAVDAMKRADSVSEGMKLLNGAEQDIDKARKALEKKRN